MDSGTTRLGKLGKLGWGLAVDAQTPREAAAEVLVGLRLTGRFPRAAVRVSRDRLQL